jgi:pSer/pThr/pTyr-binding forkhead associated (FHA) protein
MKIHICSKTPDLAADNCLETPFVLGRAEDVGLRVSNRWASRHHCKIDTKNGRVVIRDLESTHGTYVNGRKVRDAVIEPGDEISVGLAQLVLDFSPVVQAPGDSRIGMTVPGEPV